MKICTIIGARPQFIKAAVVSRAIRDHNRQHNADSKSISEILVHTGQHYDANMSDVFFEQLSIPQPDYYLGIGGGTHGQNTGRMIESIESVLIKENPNWVLVYGDTDSTLAGAIAATKLHIKLAHVEAGLRSFNRHMPEEINRVLTDHSSNLLFTPTETATKNLASEGIVGDHVKQVGDVMYDAALFYRQLAESKSSILKRIGWVSGEFALLTIHRAENTDNNQRLENILSGLALTAYPIVWPIHPRTRDRIKYLHLRVPDNILIIEPVGYLDMVMLERSATLIITDSGGVQKEAYFHKTPCLTLREETEWVETLATGWNQLVPNDPDLIRDAVLSAKPQSSHVDLYGCGRSGGMIAQALEIS